MTEDPSQNTEKMIIETQIKEEEVIEEISVEMRDQIMIIKETTDISTKIMIEILEDKITSEEEVQEDKINSLEANDQIVHSIYD